MDLYIQKAQIDTIVMAIVVEVFRGLLLVIDGYYMQFMMLSVQ